MIMGVQKISKEYMKNAMIIAMVLKRQMRKNKQRGFVHRDSKRDDKYAKYDYF